MWPAHSPRRQPPTACGMTDYRGDWLSLESALERALLTASLPSRYDHGMIDPNAPSGVRIFGKSMHVFAVGWVLAVAWLWFATLERHILRYGVAPEHLDVEALINGLLPAVGIVLIGITIGRWAGAAPTRWLRRREWVHAFWWSLVPNALLFTTVWVMIQEAR